MSTIAQAYVQIIPSTKGISGSISSALSGESASAGKSSGESIGSNLVSTLKGVIAAAGIGTLIKETLDAGGALQQSFGGIDTLYGEASTAMKEMSYQAAAAGISANTYAEQAVSFGAALKQSFGGDVTAAAEAANQAILDMADNSAKMGTDISSIQNAYQGFAKGNYTMLDNLKLGYGGTKEEMQRLIDKANELNAEQGIASNYSISSFGDIAAAIHVVQEELGVAGVAAAEAETTFTGSFGSMAAAAQNLMADLSLGADITADIQMLATNTANFLVGNFIPMLWNILSGIPTLVTTMIQTIGAYLTENGPMLLQKGVEMITSLVKGIQTKLPEVLETTREMLAEFIGIVEKNLPDILDKGIEMAGNIASGISENLPAVIKSVGEMITQFLAYILEHLPDIWQKGIEMVTKVAEGITSNMPAVISAIAEVLANFLSTIAEKLPDILQKGIEMIGQMVAGIIESIPDVISGVGEVIENIKTTFGETDWKQLGKDIIDGLVKGIKNAASRVWDAISDVCSDAFESAKEFFDIGSPSKLMADQIGRWIPAGIAEGIEDNMNPLTSAIDEIGKASNVNRMEALARQSAYSYGSNVEAGSGGIGQVVSLLEKYLPNVGSDIYVDGQKLGRVMNRRLGAML
jgi:phage-related protein